MTNMYRLDSGSIHRYEPIFKTMLESNGKGLTIKDLDILKMCPRQMQIVLELLKIKLYLKILQSCDLVK